MMKQIRNQNGLSIVEVLVAAGLTAVVSMGIATMIQNSMVEQKKATLLNTLREKKARIEMLLRDQNAWQNTLKDATNMGTTPANQSTTCLLNSQPCAEIAATAPKKLIIRDSANQVVFNLLDWAGAGSNGFTESGAACTNFSATTGTDACPISYKVVYMYSCPTGTTCVNPEIKIVARLVFSPTNGGILNKFKGLVGVGNATSIAGETQQDLGKYDAMVKRTAVQTNREFRLRLEFTGSGTNCTTGGAGTCNVGAFANYNRDWIEEDTTWNLVTAASSRYFTPTTDNDGPYSCTVSAQAFATGSFSIQLYNQTDGSVLGSATTTAGLWASSTAIMQTKFIMKASNQYTVRQQCEALPGGTPNANNCTLGIAQNYTQPTTYVTVSCYKLDVSN